MKQSTIILSGIKDVRDRYNYFVMGLFGVIHDGERLKPDAIKALEELKSANKKIAFLSNTPLRAEEMAERLEAIGFDSALYDGLLTSGEIAYHELKNRVDPELGKLGQTYYTIGSRKRAESLISAGYTPVSKIEEASFVLTTGPFSDEDSIDMYGDLLGKMLKRNLPMICTNPNKTRRIGNETQICAGYIAAKYERGGGRVIYKGKPDSSLFAYCLEGIGAEEKKECLIVGDSYEMDILPADRVHFDSLFLANGKHIKDFRRFDKTEFDDLSRHFGVFPTYAMRELEP